MLAEDFAAIEYLYNVGKPVDSIAFEHMYPDAAKHLYIRGLAVKHEWRNKNGVFLETSLTAKGKAEYLAEKERLDHERDQRAYEDATRHTERAYLDQQTQKKFRHDWRIAVFNLVGGFILGAIADHFFDVIGYALRLWRSMFP